MKALEFEPPLKKHQVHWWHKGEKSDKFWIWLAWKIPKKLVYWASIRLISAATVGQYSDTIMSELSAMDAVDRFNV